MIPPQRPGLVRGVLRRALPPLFCLLGLVSLQAVAGDGPSWAGLSPAQQQVLQPLARDWPELDAPRKQKWLEIAARYDHLPPEQQARLQQRMRDWARMTPQQRAQARLNFQQARQMTPEDRQARWQAYQALPGDKKTALAERSAQAVGNSHEHAAASAGRPNPLLSAPLTAVQPKASTGRTLDAPRSRPVAPTLVNTGPGASTRLITAPAARPSDAGRIQVHPGSVDRRTLLPRTPARPAPAPASAPAAEH